MQFGRCSCRHEMNLFHRAFESVDQQKYRKIYPKQSSTDKNNLSAEYCDKDGNCESCKNTISCGYFAPWTSWSACSSSCGGGYQERQQEFISDTINSDIAIEKRACSTNACLTLDNRRRRKRNGRKIKGEDSVSDHEPDESPKMYIN